MSGVGELLMKLFKPSLNFYSTGYVMASLCRMEKIHFYLNGTKFK